MHNILLNGHSLMLVQFDQHFELLRNTFGCIVRQTYGLHGYLCHEIKEASAVCCVCSSTSKQTSCTFSHHLQWPRKLNIAKANSVTYFCQISLSVRVRWQLLPPRNMKKSH